MKIDVKISSQQLNTLVFAFNTIPNIPVNNKEQKLAASILDKVAIKFKKKHLETSAALNLFAKKKKYNFSLEYYEAYFLEYFVALMESYPMNEYDRNVLRMIKSRLNQQLI